MPKNFKLEILAPDRAFFNGEAETLVIPTPHGELGFLANSLPTVTALSTGIMRFCQKGQWREAVCGDGFIEITEKGAVIFALSCEWPHEVKFDQLKKEYEQGLEHLKKMESLKEYKRAKANLQRQFVKLRLKDRAGD